MKILMLSWEYPPKNVGGLSNHVYYLSHSLIKLGHEVHVLTSAEGEAPLYEEDLGVFVHRAIPYSIDTKDFTKWAAHLNFAMAEIGVKLINSIGKFDVIHCHDWLGFYCGKLLKDCYNIPLVSTIHATEHGRNGGIRTDMQRYISSAEWNLSYESWKVITCSNFMKDEVKNIFTVPEDKIAVIPNGIDFESFKGEDYDAEFRRKYAQDDEKIIFYIGRHVYEKGIQLLIEAAPDIISNYSSVKFVIAGKGPMTDEIVNKVESLGLKDKVVFTGYMSQKEKIKMYKSSYISVFPSLYEPFGIVALEAMAAGCPVVVSDVGGLREIIKHKENGMKAITGSKDSIKDNVLELLRNDALRDTIIKNGYESAAENYSWDKIALDTLSLYEKVKEEAKGTEWEVKEGKPKRKAAPRKKKAQSTIKEKSETVNEKLDKESKEEAKPKQRRTRKKINS